MLVFSHFGVDDDDKDDWDNDECDDCDMFMISMEYGTIFPPSLNFVPKTDNLIGIVLFFIPKKMFIPSTKKDRH